MNSSSAGIFSRIASLYKNRKVLALLVRRDLKVRYADSVLGYVWSILDPLMLALIFWFVFTQIFTRSGGETPYIVFLLAGLLPFNWFQNAVNDSAKALQGSAKLIRSTSLPREIWVVRLVLSKGVEFLLSLPVIALFVAIYGAQLSWQLVYFIPAMLLQTILIIGLGLLIAPLVVLVRDVERIVKIAMRFLFYATPVIYSIENIYEIAVPEILKDIYILNPMTGIISLYRAGFFATNIRWDAVIASVVVSLICFVIGWKTFIKLESRVLKEL